MEGFLPIFFLIVVLKIPVLGAMWLIWWASQTVAEPTADEDDGGPKRWRAQPTGPRGPRRGPHGHGARALPDCPPGGRTRVARPPAPVRSGLAHTRGSAQPVRERVDH